MEALPESIFNMHGWCNQEKAQKMYTLIRDKQPDVTVELGVFGGRSLIPMALAHKHIAKGTCYAVDPWSKTSSTENYDVKDPNYQWWSSLDHDGIYTYFIDALQTYKVTDIVKVYRAESKDVVSFFDDESIDVMHQDANHSENTSCAEVILYAPKIKKNGYWIMDDTDWATTHKAQTLLQEHGFKLVEDFTAWKIFQKE